MRLELTTYYKEHSSYKLEMPFGTFYLFGKFYVAEINEGVHLNYTKLRAIFEEIIDFYGKDAKIGFISNRIHTYSTEPHVFNIVDMEFPILVASGFVVYNERAYRNATLEKIITRKNIRRFNDLEEAIEWVTNLKELAIL